MQQPTIAYVMFIIFTGTAILSTLVLFTRQSLLTAYILLGAICGPWGFKLINDTAILEQSGSIGIIFLLFLLGLNLQPQNLFHSLKKVSAITIFSSLVFFISGFILGYMFGYSYTECLMIGTASMFSSTIIGIKLLPTTVLHHQHTGELLISILLLQDMIAIGIILTLEIMASHTESMRQFQLMLGAFPALFSLAYLVQEFVLSYLLKRYDTIHEYIFILSIGWCLFMAEFGHALGLSEEMGAFIAGIALASNPLTFYIAESLKPLRDFFLVIFFFTIGAGFNFGFFSVIILPALSLALLLLLIKPLTFNWLLYRSGEAKSISKEVGVRLGQMSEFTLLVIYLALKTNMLSPLTTYMIEAAVIITFIISCYWTVLHYPTPLAISEKLRKD